MRSGVIDQQPDGQANMNRTCVGLNAHRQTKMTRVSAVMAAADAAKEGGFIGFGAEQVSGRGAADAGPGARRTLCGLNDLGRACASVSCRT
jgi:hypothetical protein